MSNGINRLVLYGMYSIILSPHCGDILLAAKRQLPLVCGSLLFYDSGSRHDIFSRSSGSLVAGCERLDMAPRTLWLAPGFLAIGRFCTRPYILN